MLRRQFDLGEWMSNNQTDGDPARESAASDRIPMMQRLLDNPFALLFLGITVPTVFYLLWGLMELTQIPIMR